MKFRITCDITVNADNQLEAFQRVADHYTQLAKAEQKEIATEGWTSVVPTHPLVEETDYVPDGENVPTS